MRLALALAVTMLLAVPAVRWHMRRGRMVAQRARTAACLRAFHVMGLWAWGLRGCDAGSRASSREGPLADSVSSAGGAVGAARGSGIAMAAASAAVASSTGSQLTKDGAELDAAYVLGPPRCPQVRSDGMETRFA